MRPVHLAALLIIGLCIIGSPRLLTPVSQQQYVDSVDWKVRLLHDLGNDAPSSDILNFMEAWRRAEGASVDCHNPFNTTQDVPGSTVINSHGVRCYETDEQGRQATRQTLSYNYSGYAELLAGLQTNNVALALAGLESSPWGTDTGLVREILSETTMYGQYTSSVFYLGSDGCGINARVAVAANSGALKNVVIVPGETWSFNATMGDPQYINYVTCYGVPGGYWCDVAARYLQVGRALGLTPTFQHHGIQLVDVDWEDSVAIWNEGGVAGAGQDLLLTNNTQHTVHMWFIENGETGVISGDTR